MKLAIHEPINNEIANRILEEVLKARSCRRDPNIFLYINSPGGDVDAGYSIYESLRMSGKRVITYATNNVYSCAVLIYLAGEYRFAHNHSSFMIHEPYHETGDDRMTSKNYSRNLNELNECIDNFFSLICSRCNLTMPKLKKFLQKAPDGEWYFRTDLAMKLGIVHEIGLPG